MYTITQARKIDILITSLVMREREVFDYQINIDSYTLAVDLEGSDPEVAEIMTRIRELLVTETERQKSAQLMLTVVETQLVDAGVDVPKAAKAKAVEMDADAEAEKNARLGT